MSLFGILNTGRSAITAQQSALAMTGNNIANVNTPGYTRQREVFEPLTGGGVKLQGIERLRDEFAQARLRESNSRLAGYQTLSLNLSEIEATLGNGESGIGTTMQEFFDALQDLTQQPGANATREAVTMQAGQMVGAFESATRQLSDLRLRLDEELTGQVDRINTLVGQIGELNHKIGLTGQAEAMARQPGVNEMFDERDRLLDELSGLVPVRTLSGAQNSLTVFMGGQVLLEGTQQHELIVRADPANDGLHEVLVEHPGQPASLEGKLGDSRLAALISARDDHAGAALAQVERLAATLARDFNLVHAQGTGLDGVGGRDFFTGLAATANQSAANQGGAAVTGATIVDASALTFDNYEIRFTAAGQYDVLNATTGTVVAADQTYTSGAAIEFDGMRVVIGDGPGAPVEGDVFHANSTSGMGQHIGLAAAVANNVRAIAAGTSAAPGDNTNALAMSQLREAGRVDGQTYESYYDNLRVAQASTAASAQRMESQEQIGNEQLFALADQLSGVSLDEEATNLIKFQRAFQASSRVINVADELIQSVLQMI